MKHSLFLCDFYFELCGYECIRRESYITMIIAMVFWLEQDHSLAFFQTHLKTKSYSLVVA